MTYIDHLTLNTGHLRRSWRGEVADNVVEHTRDLLADAIQSGGDAAMPVPGYRLYVEPFGSRRAALCTVYRGAEPIATIGIAARPARALWGQLIALRHRLAPEAPPLSEPQAPWCAVMVLPAIRDAVDALDWLGDFERCAAWAWIGEQV